MPSLHRDLLVKYLEAKSMTMKYLEFIPAELNELLSSKGYRWPAHLPMAASGGEYRNFQEILSFHELQETEVPIDEILDILVNGKEKIELSRIARRNYLDNWKLLVKDGSSSVIAFSGAPNIVVAWFDTEKDFWTEMLRDFNEFEALEMPSDEAFVMSQPEFFLLIGICDFFLRSFPTPNMEWEPEVPLVFNISSIREDMKNPNGWYAGWTQFYSLKDPSDEDLEAAALAFCEEKKLLLVDMPDGSNVYMLGNEFTWLIRSMAWWDKGIVLKKGKIQAYILQSSFLWLFMNEGNFWELKSISEKECIKLIAALTGTALDTDLIEKKAEEKAASFCHKCGKGRLPDDVFCRFCGTKLV